MPPADEFDDVRDPVTGAPATYCWGPGDGMTCPWPADDGSAACAGHRLAAMTGGPEYWLLDVPAGTRICPLSWPLIASY